jgi:hypothetical protein
MRILISALILASFVQRASAQFLAGSDPAPANTVKAEAMKTETDKPAQAMECAKSKAEYESSELLKKAFKRNPWTTWPAAPGSEGEGHAQLVPNGSGSMMVRLSDLAHAFGYKDEALPVEFCADSKNNKPYVMIYGRKLAVVEIKNGLQFTMKRDGRASPFALLSTPSSAR